MRNELNLSKNTNGNYFVGVQMNKFDSEKFLVYSTIGTTEEIVLYNIRKEESTSRVKDMFPFVGIAEIKVEMLGYNKF